MATQYDPPPGKPATGARTEPTPGESLGPSAAGGSGATDQPTESGGRPWVWIAVCGVLALVVVGLAVWALSLQSDLNNQRDQTAAAQAQADQVSSEMDQLTQDVDDAIDQAGQATDAAKQQLQGTLADLKGRLGALGETTPPAGASETPTAQPTATATGNATPGG